MLLNIKEDVITLKQAAKDWKHAIELAAKPLIDNGYILKGYVEDIIQNVLEAGPYIVIAPHVAIPHARPNANVLKNVIGICTLENSINFGNEINDPVKYIFILVSTSNENHLQGLEDLSELLEDDEFYKMLDNSKNAIEIIKFLESKGEK